MLRNFALAALAASCVEASGEYTVYDYKEFTVVRDQEHTFSSNHDWLMNMNVSVRQSAEMDEPHLFFELYVNRTKDE